ncbi:hypothetical protein BJX96DRAFT_142845 [Aspergillus floccosus]
MQILNRNPEKDMRHAPLLDNSGEIGSREDSLMLNSGTAGAALSPQDTEPQQPEEAADPSDNPVFTTEEPMASYYHDTTRVVPEFEDIRPVNDDNRRPRRQRRGSDSSACYDPLPPRPQRSFFQPNIRMQRLESISSHQDLIPSGPTKDRFLTLAPFDIDVYVTSHAASSTDFRHWLPLLASASADSWYAFVGDDSHPHPAYYSLHRPPQPTLKIQRDAHPVGLHIPWVAAGGALQASLPASSDHPPLIYLSVQQALMGHHRDRYYYGRDRSPMPEMAARATPAGQPIYRVVRTGSRDAASAQAFYHAGANRWPTVFTCVIKNVPGGPQYPLLDSYERVGSLEELIESTDEKEKIRVFY